MKEEKINFDRLFEKLRKDLEAFFDERFGIFEHYHYFKDKTDDDLNAFIFTDWLPACSVENVVVIQKNMLNTSGAFSWDVFLPCVIDQNDLFMVDRIIRFCSGFNTKSYFRSIALYDPASNQVQLKTAIMAIETEFLSLIYAEIFDCVDSFLRGIIAVLHGNTTEEALRIAFDTEQ